MPKLQPKFYLQLWLQIICASTSLAPIISKAWSPENRVVSFSVYVTVYLLHLALVHLVAWFNLFIFPFISLSIAKYMYVHYSNAII